MTGCGARRAAADGDLSTGGHATLGVCQGGARVWEVAGGGAELLGTCEDVAAAVAFSPDGQSVASGSWDKTVRVRKMPE